MNNRLGFLRKLNWFGFSQSRLPDQENTFQNWVGLTKLETVICLEAVLIVCHQSLAGLIHNNTIRNECQRLGQLAHYHQEGLRKVYPISQESENSIRDKENKYLLHLKSSYLFLNSVINLAINLTEQKIDIYRYLSLKDREHRILLNKFIDESKEEFNFLCRERNYHLNIMEETQSKVSLN